MKVCKKCKTQVTNKAKICKKCGSDVSKAKLIQNKNQSQNNKNKQQSNKKSTINNKKIIQNKENKTNEKQIREKTIITNNKKTPSKIENGLANLKKTLKNVLQKLSKIIKKTAKIITVIVKKVSEFAIRIIKSIYPNAIKILKKIIKKPNKKEKPKKIKKFQNKKVLKIAIALIGLIAFTAGIIISGRSVLKNKEHDITSVVKSEKATKEKVFNMGDIITYNDVDYKIVKIETSQGNDYKTPKEGNEFLIVTVYIKNNSDKKIQYSYENWTMSNSKGEEKKRIFTSINVDTALYSGELVIGGIKTGSIVFEQPIKDEKLKMNFYDLTTDEDGNQIIDEAKRIFSVSVKIPQPEEKKEIKDENTTANDLKILKATKESKDE